MLLRHLDEHATEEHIMAILAFPVPFLASDSSLLSYQTAVIVELVIQLKQKFSRYTDQQML